MKVAILGAGAVGLCIAAKLSKKCEVYAVSRKRHAEAVKERGFVMTGLWGDEKYSFYCSETLPAEEKFDYIIISSKSNATRGICNQFSRFLKNTPVVSLQNGIGNEEIIAEYTDSVIGGMIITGFEWRQDAYVNVSVQAAPIRLGVYPAGSDDKTKKLISLFKDSGMDVIEDENISGAIWGKTLYNAALNPLGAIMKVPYGKLLDENSWRIISDIVNEAFDVIRSEGIILQWNTADEYLDYLKNKQIPSTAEHHSSMYQDLSSGKKTEIEFINGRIVEIGEKNNIRTPVNKTLVNLIKFKENLISAK